VRGCNRRWIRNLYSFALRPDITFYFRVPLEVSLGRILKGRPKLKYFEAGMDLGLSNDPYESFRIFQGRISDDYDKMVSEFGFKVVDATQSINVQQAEVRRIITESIDLAEYRWSMRR